MPLRPEARHARPGSRRTTLFVATVLLVALVGLLDYWTGPEISISIFFLVPISLAAWFVGPRSSLLLAAMSAVAWFLADLFGGHSYQSPTIPYWNASVRFGFFAIIATILSARRRTEKRMYELMNIKSEFTSMVSHELRTPLTCIKEGIDIVSDGTAGALNEKQREYLQTAKRNVDRLARLLNDVLSYQKLDAGREEFQMERCDVNRLVEQVVEEFTLPARKNGLEIVAECAPGLPDVRCDRDKILQVLGNLLSNALKFSERGPIRIETALTDGSVRVAVSDSGIGIRGEDISKLFKAFTQIQETGVKKAPGTGLGLAIAQKIVDHHAGKLGVDSKPGRGSTFHFTLPALPPGGERGDAD